MLDYGFKVVHTTYMNTFHLAVIISGSPCFCDYRQLDTPAKAYIIPISIKIWSFSESLAVIRQGH
ncbi:hypothetical protein Shal_2225 [Shewanella halifaxensis HAW-EB4]|uniref:Uncharacterized protein n=1 Tax=Shewanella halifaxensis (strain HAW-EB4) TaxID=458817 RepID=B0TUQ6_SHEHH|nr:hypothetical protein Shal_2225 [Shewanella halifaxensis HAW-EB4]